jgi:GNAT superfamily N-acetyltransferase
MDTHRFTIEEFDYSDVSYADCVEINNLQFDLYPETIDDWKRWDNNRNPKRYYHRLAVRDAQADKLIAVGVVANVQWGFHPRKYAIDIAVHPQFEGQGIGKALYQALYDDVAATRPISFESSTASHKPRGIRFLEDRRYELKTREYASRLELDTFDPTPFQVYLDRVMASAIEFINHDELGKRFPDDWLRRLYDANVEMMQDIPYHEKPSPDPFDVWQKRHLDHKNRVPETFLLAMDGDEIVGVTMLFTSEATADTLFTGLTAVKRPYRRRGLAMALKLANLSYAKANFRTAAGNAPAVMTENEENNPMFTINEKFGFVRQPDWLIYKLSLVEDEQAEIDKDE